MQPTVALALGLGTLSILTLAALLVIRKPLLALLEELCGREHRARFWLNLFQTLLFLNVLFFSSLWTESILETRREIELRHFLGMYRAGLFGLLMALGMLGVVMLAFVRRFEASRAARPAPSSD